MTQIPKSNLYDKVSTRLAPNFLLIFMTNFNNDMEGMRPFIGNTFNGDVSETMNIFNLQPIPLEKTVLDTAKAVEQVLEST
jgi:dihydroflavonol-4-reductase